MLAHVRCAGVQPASAGLQPPDRVHWLACYIMGGILALTFAHLVQAGTQDGTMLGRTPCAGCSLRMSETVGVVLVGIGL